MGEPLPVVLVEDDAHIADLVSLYLDQSGFRVYRADNGRDGLRVIDERQPRLVILDVGLPEGDGFSVVEWMRGEPTLRDTPLLVYSAADLTSSDHDRLRLGRTIFLTKSRASFPELEKCVLSLIRDSEEVEGAA